jgi:hypothetical protein
MIVRGVAKAGDEENVEMRKRKMIIALDILVLSVIANMHVALLVLMGLYKS